MLRRTAKRHEPPPPVSDLTVVQRAARTAAIQASLALAAVLLVVGSVVFVVDVRVQNNQISRQLQTVAATADDVNDPPPGMELVLRDNNGRVAVSDDGQPGVGLLSGATGFNEVEAADGTEFRSLVADRPEGRVVALLDLTPYRAGRARLLMSLGFAELAGILASIAVAVLFTRRSVRPLAQALALQRRFVADASHELRAPLTVLHTRAQMLARRAADGDARAVKKDADALVADTRVLGDIVDDLLASATMTAGTTARDAVDLAKVAAAVCDSATAHAATLGVTIVFATEQASRLEVIGSEAALRRALTSLIDNALAHEHDGGTVEVRVSRRNGKISVTVADDGVGIDPDTSASLFTRFSHGVDHTGAASRRPYGIGLALVREIAHAHNGDIAVESTPGQGATFTLTLPAAAG